jgi:hypothetical protein
MPEDRVSSLELTKALTVAVVESLVFLTVLPTSAEVKEAPVSLRLFGPASNSQASPLSLEKMPELSVTTVLLSTVDIVAVVLLVVLRIVLPTSPAAKLAPVSRN